jgi:hypothetical protein
MSYTQHIHDCPLHAACHVIVCTDDSTGRAVWESHDTADQDPLGRLNPDHPHEDHRA